MAINTATNFSVGANLPIDDRLVVNTVADLANLLSFEGLVSYVKSEKTEYIFKDGVWGKYEKESKPHISSVAPSPTDTDVWFDTSETAQAEEPMMMSIPKPAGDSLLNQDELLPDNNSSEILIDSTNDTLITEDYLLTEG